MTDKPSRLQKLWNILGGKHPQQNADGTVTTCHGRHIIPYRSTLDHRGGIVSNLADVLAQPRMHELIAQMQPLAQSHSRDKLVLDETSGFFYLKSDITKNTLRRAEPLGQIDPQTEKDLFILAAEETLLRRAFPAAGQRKDLPPLYDDMTGKTYDRQLPPLPPSVPRLPAPLPRKPEAEKPAAPPSPPRRKNP
ncbi:MAG: hypothetical protein RBS08_08810 [Bdellovibrionales bacterium]|jgi:hypothetical protein|nr:hypothetical protein [Bdellovibrionales bacterium]